MEGCIFNLCLQMIFTPFMFDFDNWFNIALPFFYTLYVFTKWIDNKYKGQ